MWMSLSNTWGGDECNSGLERAWSNVKIKYPALVSKVKLPKCECKKWPTLSTHLIIEAEIDLKTLQVKYFPDTFQCSGTE